MSKKLFQFGASTRLDLETSEQVKRLADETELPVSTILRMSIQRGLPVLQDELESLKKSN